MSQDKLKIGQLLPQQAKGLLPLCELQSAHLKTGAWLYGSCSIVISLDRSAAPSAAIADIDGAVSMLAVLRKHLANLG